MKIKALALFLAFAMVVLAFAGCAGIREAGSASGSTQASSTQATSSTQAGNASDNTQAPTSDQIESTDDEAKETNDSQASVYVSLDINPEISITADEFNQVTGIFAENEDAQVLLYGEEDLVGTDLEEAIEKITSLAIELGYINEENKVVGVMVSAENEESVTEIANKIDQRVQKIAKEMEIDITISEESAYSLLCQLEELKEQHPESKKIQELTPSKFKLARTAFEAGEMTIEEAVEMENKELIERVGEAFKKIDKYATESYDEAKRIAEKKYEKVVSMALEGVYAELYIKNADEYPTTYYYGTLYQLYVLSQRGYTELAEKLARAEEIKSCELTEEQAKQIAEALGIEGADELANEDGKITIESVEDFADKKIKNSHKSERLDEIKDKLKGELKEVRKEIEGQIKAEREQLSSNKNETLECVAQILQALEMTGSILNDEARTELEAYIREYNEITSVAEELTAEKVQEIVELLGQKADEILAKIENDLSQEDKDAIEARKAEIEEGLTEAEKELEEAVENAKQQVKNHLEQEKANRIKAQK